MIDRLIKFTTLIFFLLFPLYFLPLGNTSADYDKQIVLLVFSLLLFLLTAIKTLSSKKITLVQTPFDVLFILLTLLYFLSALLISPNKMESLLSPMGTISILSLTLLYFSLTNTSVPLNILVNCSFSRTSRCIFFDRFYKATPFDSERRGLCDPYFRTLLIPLSSFYRPETDPPFYVFRLGYPFGKL